MCKSYENKQKEDFKLIKMTSVVAMLHYQNEGFNKNVKEYQMNQFFGFMQEYNVLNMLQQCKEKKKDPEIVQAKNVRKGICGINKNSIKLIFKFHLNVY